MRASALIACAWLAGCGEAFLPESLVTDLRVLGVKAEPAELRPGESTALSALVVDPTRPPFERTLVWLSCDPDPFAQGRSACSDIAQLQDLSQLLSASGSVAFPPGMRFAGFGNAGAYTVPADLFSPLAADDARRQTGTVAQILLLSVAQAISPFASEEELDALFGRIERKEVPFIATLFRVRVSEETQRNVDPVLEQVLFAGLPAPSMGGLLRVDPDREVEVVTRAPAASFEPFTLRTPEGPEERTEALVVAYYSTVGRFSQDRISLGSTVTARYQPPGVENRDRIPADRQGRIWAVMRDTRGGQAWTEVPFYLCDKSLPVPALTAVTNPTPAAGTRVTLQGTNLASVLEVEAGGLLFADPDYDSGTGALDVTVPLLSSGTYALTLRTRLCTDVATSVTVTIP